ncbi:hypothetical protein KAI04_04325 [Candidatus Pacearchaeota archaeon]|nr:hypothetical protein [Candidatus Pacearchaeota archaeon]
MKLKDPKRVSQGKKNRAAGARFELKVRKDLEDKNWIVSKWMNNVDLREPCPDAKDMENKGLFINRLIPAKHKFRGPGIPMAIGTGFCDFLVMRRINGKEILEILKNEI